MEHGTSLMMSKKGRNSLGKILGRVILCLLAVVAVATITCLGLAYVMPKTAKTEEKLTDSTKKPQAEPKIVAVNAKYLFAGTTFWGRRTNKIARASDLGVRYPFSQLSTLDREKYNAWIVGIECPIVDKGGKHSEYEENTQLKFNCDPDYLPEAKKYFDVAMLGNNHTDNQGEAGFKETQDNLSKNGIQYFGSYDYLDGEKNCDVVVLEMNISKDDQSEAKIKMPFGFCSAHGVFGIPKNAVMNMAKYAKILPTIAMPHMGAEYQPEHDQIRQNLYHSMINAGVEMVVGDHPHWIQDVEVYKGKLIVYSMGNFMFDQSRKETTRSAAITAEVKIENLAELDLVAWNRLGETCLNDKTNCLAKIEEAKLTRPKYAYNFDYIGTTTMNDTPTHRASEAEQAEIGSRLKWQTAMRALGQK